jgi:hypothetical protein
VFAPCFVRVLQYSQLLEPLRPTSKPAARRLQELLACHKRFCDLQLANKKTSRVLEAAFDAEFTQQYMEQVRSMEPPVSKVERACIDCRASGKAWGCCRYSLVSPLQGEEHKACAPPLALCLRPELNPWCTVF